MTCQRARSLIEDYVDSELSTADAELLKKHLDQCGQCRQEFLASQRLRQLLKETTKYDPGRDYWSQMARLVQARTIEIPWTDGQKGPLLAQRAHVSPSSLTRALVSLVASLSILVSAMLIVGSHDQTVSHNDLADAPVLATAPVSELLSPSSPVVTQAEQIRLAKGMLLLGSPGFLGRFAGLQDLTISETSP